MATVRESVDRTDTWIDSLVADYIRQLEAVTASAEARVVGDLLKKLAIASGRIARTPANQRVLRQVDDIVNQALEKTGYYELGEEFARQWNGMLPRFEETLDAMSQAMKTPLPRVAWGKPDTDLFVSQQITAVEQLGDLAGAIALDAKKAALFNVGALDFGDLTATLSTRLRRGVAEAQTIASTSTVMFSRTVAERGFQKIEAALPDGSVRYAFEGPVDKFTRPFCRHLVERAKRKPMSRAEIEKLDNGHLPNVFITGGGYNCRHQWVISRVGSTNGE